MRHFLIVVFVAVAMVGCGGGNKRGGAAGDSVNRVAFERVMPPPMITDEIGVGNFLAENFWQNCNFADTTLLSNPDTQHAFAEYVTVIRYADPATMKNSLRRLFREQASVDSLVLAYFAEMADDSLYDPNSPMRNEEMYIVVMEELLASPKYDETMKLRLLELLDMAQKNRVGTRALDFDYQTIDGRASSLYKTKGQFVLLFFNNPDCAMCNEISDYMAQSQLIAGFIDHGIITVLALYPDEELTRWREYAPNMPAKWINAHDPGRAIEQQKLYDLKAIPTLYLLDTDKNVIIKDGYIEEIDSYLGWLSGQR